MAKKLKQEEFIERVRTNYGTEYEALTSYTKAHEKVLVKHVKCGYEWMVDPWSLMQKHLKGCPQCSNKWKRDTDSFKKEVALLYDGEYEVVGEYKSTNTALLMRHKVCGNEFMRLPREFKQGVRCPKCRRPNYYESSETFATRLNQRHHGKYVLLSEYVSARKPVVVNCNKCGNTWETTPDSLMSGHGCPKCTISHGEIAIENWLGNHGFKYKGQYSNRECKDIRALRFDFAVFDEFDDEPMMLIEYDGVQHFKPTRFNERMSNSECERNLSDVQRKDKIKENFCKTKEIPLLRISYKDFDKIESILANALTKTIPCQADI